GGVVLARRAAPFALLLHEPVKLRDIDFNAVAAHDILCEIERKTVGVIKSEGDFARECTASRIFHAVAFRFDEFKAAIQSFAETLFLLRHHVLYAGEITFQLFVSAPHRRIDAVADLRKKGAMDSQVAPMTRGSPDKPAKHVLPVGVSGCQPFCD